MGAGAEHSRETLLLLLLLLLSPSPPLEEPTSAALPAVTSLAPVCGKPKVVGKVFDGQDVVAGQWPWQASLLYHGLHLCGAVLIDSYWVLSTAHCFLNKSHAPKDYQVLLGNTQLYQQTQHTQKMSVNRIITHPDFEKFHPFGSDIAMLQLHLPVNFTSYVIPACLPPPGVQLPMYRSCWITGWGMLSEKTPLLPPFHLQEGKVGLMDNELCNMLYVQRTLKSKKLVHEEMLCAGDFSSGKSICYASSGFEYICICFFAAIRELLFLPVVVLLIWVHLLNHCKLEGTGNSAPEQQGDSGGPLVCQLSSAWVLVGLASWSLDCRPPVYPSVFTRVAYFAAWIDGIEKATPVPDDISAASQTKLPGQLHAAACLPRLYTSLVSPQALPLLLHVLRAPWQTLW